MAKLLIAGGAGYVGSHVCKALAAQGHDLVVFDSLEHGHDWAVKWGRLCIGNLLDPSALKEVFTAHQFDAVLHFAGLILVGESVKRPDIYYQNNVTGSLNLLQAMTDAGVRKIVFSSTAAVYGTPKQVPVREDAPLAPINPYGTSKLMVEQMLGDFDQAHGMKSVILRYFNASGASADSEIGEDHDPETHAIPLAIGAALGQRAGFKVMGDDYPTPDGTALRDYIHVEDLARAHVMALEHLLKGGNSDIFNLGGGQATSVKEILDMVEKVVGNPVPHSVTSRRPGDPAELTADAAKAEEVLGWTAEKSLEDIVTSATAWHKKHHS
ncbi:UDP-glucose 4-epimerase GalE [Rhodovibrionaceae bacterium A322]